MAMAFPTGNIGILLCACLTASCEKPIPEAPPSAGVRMVASEDGFYKLLERECLQQDSREWAVQHSDFLRDDCDGFLASEGEIGDCKVNVEGYAPWTISTVDGSHVDVNLSWEPDQPGDPRKVRLDCEVSVPDRLGPALQAAAFRFSREKLGISEPLKRETLEGDEYWRWKPKVISETTPAVAMDHYQSIWEFRVQFNKPVNRL